MGIYYKSILIYWQQTYHSDLLHSDSLTYTATEQQNDVISEDETNQQNIALLENDVPTQSNDIALPANDVQQPKLEVTQSEVIKEDGDGKHIEKQSNQVEYSHEQIVKDNVEPETSNHIDNQNLTMNQQDVTLTEVSDVPLLDSPAPIVLTEHDKVFFAGDSLMQGVAPYVKKMLFKQYKIESFDLSKQSTGLAYPSAFDWPKAINDNLVANPSIKLLVVFLGPNDPWDFPVKGYVKYAKFKSELWEEQYRLRIEAILNSAREHNVQVLWLAAPCMRKPKLNEGMIYLNILYKSELERNQQHFLTTNNLLGCTYEKFNNFIETDKEKIKVRVDDGIHFTSMGQKILAKAIMEKITFKE
ncbi:hypothetical protein A9G12_06685 [Gilliamella sp. wkB112]|nr:hypothetical protein A9G12_06685 [Gilliamella apicola]